MKMRNVLLFSCLLLLSGMCYAQKAKEDDFPVPYFEFYPIGDDPNLGYKTSIVKSETILFEANPTIRYSFFNNIYRGLQNSKKHTQAYYVSFRPQIRMYTDNSLPVRTPSYRILLGMQQLWRHNDDLFAISLESGHYSNGQDGGAFTEKYADGSPESEAIYNTITPSTNLSAILNRKSGNFSTDLTELICNYRFNTLDSNFAPKRTHSVKVGATLYHDYIFGLANVGGYTPEDIKIYGRLRTTVGYQFINTFREGKGIRLALSENIETIYNAHPSVQPWRFETTATIYPFRKIYQFGFFANFTWGHDNYNYRFVDSGSQFFIGITWSVFPPFSIRSI